jgi:hypothetical protein
MRQTWIPIFAVAVCVPYAAGAQVADLAVRSQWFTGSLEAPSPALPKAGLLAIEPYLIFQRNHGSYDNGGVRHSNADAVHQSISVTAIKYGITNRLSVQALPSVVNARNDLAQGTGVGDLPAELEYRFSDKNGKTGFPSVTAAFGGTLPIGRYDRLSTPLDGLGSGAYTVQESVVLQSLFDTWGHHPVRARVYGVAVQPIDNVSLHDVSVYGTTQGFSGQATPGKSGVYGIGAGYAFTQRWVLAADVLQRLSQGSRVTGVNGSGASVNTLSAFSRRTAIAPAMECNFTSRLGVIAGVEFSVAGRNMAAYVAPQLALSMVF